MYDQIVQGGLNNTTDPIEMQAAQTERKDANYYCFFGPPLFDHCKAAAAGIPAAVQQVVNLVAAGDQTMLQDFIDNPQLVLGGSGSGFPFHQHGEAVLQLLTGRKRWWLLDGAQIPPSGYRYDMSQLQWVQYVLPKLHVPPQVGKPSTCTQEPGEVMYVPDSFWHATLNIGETLAVGAQAGQDGWEVIHKDRGALINEVLIASQSQQQQVSAKQARKLVTKVDRMLRQYGANSHLLDAKVRLSSLGIAPVLPSSDCASCGGRLGCWQAKVQLRQAHQPTRPSLPPLLVRAIVSHACSCTYPAPNSADQGPILAARGACLAVACTDTTSGCMTAPHTADPVSESTVEKYAMWLSGQNDRFNDALAQWFALVKLGPLEPGPYLYWASMMLMPSNPSTGGFNLSPKGLKIVADTLRKAVQRILSRKKDPPLWAAGTVVDIESEDGLESGATVLGPSENGDQSERRVKFKDGVFDDWPIVDFRKPWAVGDIVDIDTEDGWEGGAKVLGPSHSGDALELHVEFADGTVDDWATADFRRPAAPTDFSVGSKEAVVQKICNAGVLVYAVAGVTGGREIIDECKQFGIGLTVTAADLKLSVSERAAKGRAEIKASLQALRAAENPAFAAIEQAGVGDDAIGKAVLTTEGATKVLQKMAEREYPLAYVAAAKQGRRIEVVPNAPQASGGDGGGGSTLGSLSGPGRVNSEGFDTSADDRGGWGGGCAAAAAAATAEIGCDFDRRFVSVNGGQDGGLTPVTFVSEYVAKMKPVILRTKDAKGLLKDWEAWKIWSRKGMLERYGSVKVNISASSSIVKLRQGGDLNADMRERTIYQTELSEYINEVMGRSGTDRSVLDEKDPPYLFRARQLPGLQQDYGHLELFNDTKVFHHDRATRERIALFFVGPSNSGAHFHQHMNAYNALVYGAKRWFVLPPQADKGEGQPSMLDW